MTGTGIGRAADGGKVFRNFTQYNLQLCSSERSAGEWGRLGGGGGEGIASLQRREGQKKKRIDPQAGEEGEKGQRSSHLDVSTSGGQEEIRNIWSSSDQFYFIIKLKPKRGDEKRWQACPEKVAHK